MRQKLFFIVNVDWFFISHRLPIAVEAVKQGYDVHIATTITDSVAVLEECGLTVHPLKLHRTRTGVVAVLAEFLELLSLIRIVAPDILHLVTIKPVLLGGIAARWVRVPAVVSAMAGLGFVFIEQKGIKADFLRRVIKPLFRWALGHPHQTLIFQNPGDRDRVLSMARISLSQTQLIRGSGIDLSACPVLPEPEGPPIVAMASRLLRDKGVLEFVASARLLRERSVSARFWLVGDPDLTNPASVTPQEVAAWQAEGVVECLGHRPDVPSLYAQAHIVTLPSYYGEGLPKSLIEAAACGRAVVTTDMPGCRDAIESDVTGLLVPPRDAIALADALEHLIRDVKLRQTMGKAGRALAEREFGIEKVVDAHLRIYKDLLEPCAP